MTKQIMTALAFAAFIAGPTIAPLHAATTNTGIQVAQATPEQDCSQISDAQLRAECLKEQGK